MQPCLCFQSGFNADHALAMNAVLRQVRAVFTKHGALHVATPLLLPKLDLYENLEHVAFMLDRAGNVVLLPHDLKVRYNHYKHFITLFDVGFGLQVSFARYAARRNVTNLRRFAIEKVYRENRWHDSHPNEIHACSFDIVTPQAGSGAADAEVIFLNL